MPQLTLFSLISAKATQKDTDLLRRTPINFNLLMQNFEASVPEIFDTQIENSFFEIIENLERTRDQL